MVPSRRESGRVIGSSGVFAEFDFLLGFEATDHLDDRQACGLDLAVAGGAQFIVHRNRIRLRSKAFYERLMDYILTEDSLSTDGYHSDMSFYMEYIWHFIFGETAVTNCTSDRHFAKFRVDMDHELGKISYYL